MTFSANPVTGVMVVTTLTVSGLDITVEPFPGIKPQLHEPVPGKRNDVQYLRLSRGKRAVYILPDMNAAVTGGGKRITLGGGTSRLFIIEPGSQGSAAKVKRVAANASVAEDPDSRDKHGDAASVFSARTSIYLRRADFGEDGLYSDLAKYCFRAARNLRAKTGGIRCSEQNWFCDAGSMSDYLHFASVFGLKPLADGIADTFYRMMRENGRFPQLFSQDGKRVGMPYNATSLSGLAAILSLFRYEEFYRLPHTRLCNLAGKVLGEQLPLIKTGMLPYSGAEPGFITGEFSGKRKISRLCPELSPFYTRIVDLPLASRRSEIRYRTGAYRCGTARKKQLHAQFLLRRIGLCQLAAEIYEYAPSARRHRLLPYLLGVCDAFPRRKRVYLPALRKRLRRG